MLKVGTCFALVLVAASACERGPEWVAFVYPNRENLDRFSRFGPYDTFEQCQEGAINALRLLPDPDSGDYECGFKCRMDPALGINVCKETRK